MTTFLAAILVFGLLIASHEFGHFITAKLSGVKVLEFAIGMGPKLFAFEKGGTNYTLRLLPIGGYVKMLGEEDETNDPRAFCNQSPWKRLIIILAGAIMNILIAIILFTLVFYNKGTLKPIVSKVETASPAYTVGIKQNDEILAINNEKVRTWNDVLMYISQNKGESFDIKIKQGETVKDINVTPKYNKEEDRYMIGIAPTRVNGSMIDALKDGFVETFSSIKQMLNFLGTLITGQASMDGVGGPVAIIDLSGKAAEAGIWTLMTFIAFLSINLGVLNLIPFPALDGGWVIILLIEALTGKKINENKLGIINMIGFAALMTFILFVTFKDILRLFN